jgi:type VI secretion system protein ImpA
MPRAVGAPALIDLQSLLSPIGDASPCGRDPRLDPSPTSPYQVVKDARAAASAQETAFERGFGSEDEARTADQARRRAWATIRQRGPEILATIGKDLSVAVWVTEALLRAGGLAGLRDGLALTSGLIDQYWDGLYPVREPDEPPDEAEPDPRVVAIQPLAGSAADCRVVPALRRVQLSNDDGAAPLTLWDLERTRTNGGDGEAEPPDTRLQRSTPEFLRDLVDDAGACLAGIERLEAALQPRCGANAPGFSGVRELVQKIGATVRGHVPSAPDPAAAAPEAVPDEQIAPEQAASPARTGPAVLDRQSAFRQLQEVAQYFRRTEPHSPLAYAIENLVRRGHMTLPELIEELIGDETARRNYYITAGILPPENKTS